MFHIDPNVNTAIEQRAERLRALRADDFSRANDYQRASIQAQLAYRSLELIRAKHPELPPVFAQT